MQVNLNSLGKIYLSNSYFLDESLQHSQQYELGAWVVCPKNNTLQNSADQKSLDYKSMQVILFLIQHAGQDVTKEQIIEHVWKESVVNEEILSVAISKIRKALGDNARKPTYIKTLPNLGYCLIANVKPLGNSGQLKDVSSNTFKFSDYRPPYFIVLAILFLIAVTCAISFTHIDKEPEQIIAVDSIAVLPFEDLTEKKDNQYFSDGLSDAIINQLSQTKSLKVISRYSSFNFRGNRDPATIGNTLKVEALLDGSVQRAEEQVRVNVRIFSTFDGRLLWSKSFDSNNNDIFYLQDKISRNIKLAIKPSSKPRITPIKKINSQAYEWFLMAQYHWQQRTPTSLSKAQTYLKHSLELEPNYADAHVGLATTYAHFHYYGNWSAAEAIDKALPHIEQALALEPNSPKALATKGMLLTLMASYSKAPLPILNEAQDMFVLSLELEDNATAHHWYSSLLKQLGREALVIKHIERAIALNPLSASLKHIYSRYLAIIGKLDSAQKMHNRALILEPDHDSSTIESTHVIRNTPNLIMELAQWQSNHRELFEHCSSDTYCEQAVFSYLSIAHHKEADKILDRMRSKHQHFKDSLQLINYGLNGETNNAVLLLEQLSAKNTNNYKYKYSLAIALFRAGLFEQAKSSVLRLYPDWSNISPNHAAKVTTDNYLALVLYGAIQLNLEERESATALLNGVGDFLTLNKVQDQAQAELTLAEINAQLGNTAEALEHLEKALNHGWLATFDREWWPLQDNHLLKSINSHPEFNKLLQVHQEQLELLRQKVSLKLEST